MMKMMKMMEFIEPATAISPTDRGTVPYYNSPTLLPIISAIIMNHSLGPPTLMKPLFMQNVSKCSNLLTFRSIQALDTNNVKNLWEIFKKVEILSSRWKPRMFSFSP
jgi:hypothetical protein